MAMTRGLSSHSLVAEEAIPKRQKLGSDDVCVVLEPSEGLAECRYYIYIVDLNEKDSPSLVRRYPDFRLTYDFPGAMAFALVNSTLYLFGGCTLDWLTASYSIHLSPQSNTCDVSLNDISINMISPLMSEKDTPRAVLIGDQICVFSRFLGRSGSNFELYDPCTNEWTPLPEPPIDFTNIPKYKLFCDRCEVKLYWIENLCLFISTVKGSYFIDFSQPTNDRNWVPCDLPLLLHGPSLHTHPLIKDGSLVFMPAFTVYDLNSTIEPPLLHRPFSVSSIGRDQVLKPKDKAIVRFPKKGAEERLKACIVEVGGFGAYDSDWRSDSALGFCLFKYDDHAKDRTILNSRLFYLEEEIFTYKIHIAGVFSMQ